MLDLMPFSGADIIDLDWMVPIADARDQFGSKAAICGNFDPVAIMLQGTPADVRAATTFCLRQSGDNSFNAAGCEIPDGTPHPNLDAQIEVLRESGNPIGES